MVQCKRFYLHKTEIYLLGNLKTEKAFWLCFGSMLFSISKELRFLKWVRFFEQNCIVNEWSFWLVFIGFEIFGYKFCNKNNSDDVHWNVWTKVVGPKKYFQKENYKYEVLNHLSFGTSFVFLGITLGCFSQFFLLFSSLVKYGSQNFDWDSPTTTIKKLPTNLILQIL